jgi:hypothetical protein
MERLRELLQMKSWPTRWAVYITFGTDPETTMRSDEEGWNFDWLPDGNKDRPKRRQTWGDIQNDDANFETIWDCLKGEGPPSNRLPSQWLTIAIKHDLTPPWLPAAAADHICRRFLPPDALRNFEVDLIPGMPKPTNDPIVSAVMSRLAKDGRKASPKGKAIEEIKTLIRQTLTTDPRKLQHRSATKTFAGELYEMHKTKNNGVAIIEESSIVTAIRQQKKLLDAKVVSG